MKTYEASREDAQPLVVVGNGTRYRKLTPGPSQQVANHAPYGFEWGYHGDGPSQLALAILLDVTRNASVASRHYQAFKKQFIGPAPEAGFTITSKEIRLWLAERNRDSAS
jgi:hypothetical protein